MDTIAFFNIPAYGHIRPTLPVVEHLVRRGCRVLYFITEDHHDVVAATGAEVRIVPNYTGTPQVSPKSGSHIAAALAEQAYRTLSLLVEQVKAENVGLIVHDSFCAWGMFVAQLTGRPSVRTCSVFLGSVPRPLGASSLPALLIFLRHDFNLFDWLRFRKYRRKLIREFKVRRFNLGVATADRSILFTAKEFISTSEQMDDRSQFVGASFSDTGSGKMPIPDPGDRPLVYISLGTTFTDEPGFFQACKDAFGATDALVVLSLGRRTDPKSLEPWPDNFTVAPFVPQLEILKKATVFVMQAGGCSVSEALYHDVPLVMVPLTSEHLFNAKLVEAQEAGVILPKKELTADRLRDVALSVATDATYRSGARRLGKALRDAGGPARATEVILDFHPAARPESA